jgi:hypothetical protein
MVRLIESRLYTCIVMPLFRSVLNVRLPFGIDLKLFAELRNSWVLLFTLTLANAAKMYEEQVSYISLLLSPLFSFSLFFSLLRHMERIFVSALIMSNAAKEYANPIL